MNANKHPCSTCQYFDPVLRGTKSTKWGWCTRKSVYPLKEGPGQVFPPGVQRVENAEEPARPFLVQGQQIIIACMLYAPKKAARTKKELTEALTKKDGKVVLR